MKKRIIITVCSALFLFLLLQMANAGDQGLFFDISESSPIADRTIPINATTNPIAFTVSDSDGGPLIVQCTSSNPALIPNDKRHINIEGKGPHITVDAGKNEKKHLTARIIPVQNQSGSASITFKVTDSGGLFATKSMRLTVTTQTINPTYGHYAFVPSRMIEKIQRWLFASEKSNVITLSVLGNGHICMDDQIFEVYQQIIVDPDQQLQIEAKPAEKWQFAYWSGDLVDTQNPLNLTPQDQLSLQAVFISNEENLQQDFQRWRLHLFLSDKQIPNVPISEISLGVSESTHIMPCDQEKPMLSIVTDSGITPLSDHIITESNEQFRLIRIAQGAPKNLYWEFEQLSPGTFELLDATTHDVYISDMQEINQWKVPELLEPMDLLIHYLP
jgi:hypothetical protein